MAHRSENWWYCVSMGAAGGPWLELFYGNGEYMPNEVPITRRHSWRHSWTVLVCVGVVVLALGGCKEEKKEPAPDQAVAGGVQSTPVVTKPKPVPVVEPDPTDGPMLDRVLLERIARQLLEAGASGGQTGMIAKEIVSARLGLATELLDNADEHVMWGALDASKGVDPEANQVMQLPPLVWARAYLSCFEFTGTFKLRQEEEFGVLEMGARFRAGLPAGEYPHPLWHSIQEWNSYARTNAIVLAFYHGSFVAAYRKSNAAAAVVGPEWNGAWVWKDAGGEQPRGGRVEVSLSTSNPHAAGVDAAYRKLVPMLTAQKCFTCHTPDNPAGASVLVLLRYPAAAMAAKDALAAVLRENSMPPGNPATNMAEGIGDERARQEMIEAADAWGMLVHEALEFEKALRKPAGSGATSGDGAAAPGSAGGK